ncbi:MAG: CPBP family intramembrane metalloprotease [Acidobacteria bacterium]|nr:CPBP family intramembrane metalloprotease [Acidobacteriota bacterium]
MTLFLVLTVLLSIVTFSVYNSLGGYTLYLTAFMWSPGFAAILTLKLTKRSLASLGWNWGDWRYQWESYLLPIGYVAAAYLIIWTLGLAGFPNHAFVERLTERYGLQGIAPAIVIAVHVIMTGSLGVVTYAGTALGEEIGWRGFLVPELAKHLSIPQVGLVAGLIWALWHVPLFLVGGGIDRATLLALACFTLMVLGLSMIMTWLRCVSGSLWTGVWLHASHNVFVQRIATPLTESSEGTDLWIDETGLILPLVVVALGLVYWRRAKSATPTNSPSPDK